MVSTEDNNNPFSDWSSLINKSVYSFDGKRLGIIRKTSSDYMIVAGGLINLSRYFISKLIAESASKSGIKFKITTYEAPTHYSYTKMKNFVSSLELVPEESIEYKAFYDRFTSNTSIPLVILEIDWQQLLHLLLVFCFCFQDTRQIL
jgi:hypothetical protein